VTGNCPPAPRLRIIAPSDDAAELKSDPDHQFEGTGQTPADPEFPSGESSAGNNGGFRPFRSWGTAYETQATVWSRVRGRLAGIFTRNNSNHAEDGSTPGFLTEQDESASGGVAPPDNFKFPWASDLKPTASDEVFSTVDDALPSDAAKGGLRRALARPGRWLQRLVSRTEKNASSDHESRVGAAAHVLDDVVAQIAPATGPTSDLPLLEIEEITARTDEFAVPRRGLGADRAVTDGDTLELRERGFFASFWARLFGSRSAASEAAAEQGEAAKAAAGFLLSKFRAFYNEIIRFQHQKNEFTAGFATAVMAVDNPDAEPDAEAEGLSKRLSELLELQAAEAKWMGGEVAQRYPDAQFAMAALADELFTHSEWDGQLAWSKHLLEMKLFKTHGADVELFKRIDRLLKEQPDSGVARDLARVYLLVLAAGFQGKYRPFALQRPLAEYRQRLYEYVHSGDPLLLYADGRRLFPATFERTLVGQAVRRFTSAQRWAAILLIIALGYTIIAHVAWSRVSADLQDVTSRIKSTNGTSTMSTGAR